MRFRESRGHKAKLATRQEFGGGLPAREPTSAASGATTAVEAGGQGEGTGDDGDVRGLAKRINGGETALSERAALTKKALKALI